jgi:ssDNA-binding Zn-finger/Zn-ribbon topoisomerase 1
VIRPAVCPECGAETTEVQSAKTGQWIMCEKSPMDAVQGGTDIFITMGGARYIGRQRDTRSIRDAYAYPVQVYKLHQCRKEEQNETD